MYNLSLHLAPVPALLAAEPTNPWPGAIASVVVALITAGGTVIAAVLNIRKAKKQVESAETRAEALQEGMDKLTAGILSPEPIEPGDKRNAIILAGLGGSGKTTMVRGLTHDMKAEPAFRTEEFMIYRAYRSIGENRNTGRQRHCRFYMADYPGENLSSLIRQFLLEQKKPFSPFAYGHISSLLLMVDLRPPHAGPGPEPGPENDPDDARIKRHLDEWSEMALDALFGLLTKDTLKYVCLFINKSDLVLQGTKSGKEKIIKEFQPLVEKLTKRCSGLQFDVIYGSAKQGTGLNELILRLIDNSYEP